MDSAVEHRDEYGPTVTQAEVHERISEPRIALNAPEPLPPLGAAGIGTVDAIVTCHNYARYLPQCLESCLRQTVRFNTILVVDDASTDDTAAICARFASCGVRYLRVDFTNAQAARNAGVQALARQRFLLFVDADNFLEPNYVEALLQPMRDPAIGVAYARLRHFDEAGKTWFSEDVQPYDYELLRRHNIADNCSLLRREAYDQVGGYPDPGDHRGLSDWLLWLYVTRSGWKMQMVTNTHLHYRNHRQQMSSQRDVLPTYERGVLRSGFSIAIVTLFAGRTWALPRYFRFLRSLDWPKLNLTLIAIDNSNSGDYHRKLRRGLRACGLSYVCCKFNETALADVASRDLCDSADLRVSNAYTMCAHMARLYAFARRKLPLETDMIWTLEDDIEPPANALETLMFALARNPGADVAAAVVTDRFTRRALVWDSLPGIEWPVEKLASRCRPGEVTQVMGTGFGCTLFRRSLWERFAFRASYGWTDRYCAYDCAVSLDIQEMQRQWLLCGDVRCKHWQQDGTFV